MEMDRQACMSYEKGLAIFTRRSEVAFGDKYRIVPSTGNLQLLDDDGLSACAVIRVATRLAETLRKVTSALVSYSISTLIT